MSLRQISLYSSVRIIWVKKLGILRKLAGKLAL